MFDMLGMMGRFKDLQGKLKEAQANLVNVLATGEAGGGLVKVTVNGQRQVVRIELEEGLLQPGDREMVQDLVVAAVNKALTEVDGKAKEQLKQALQDAGLPNIPGLDLSSLLG